MEACDECQLDVGTVGEVGGEISMKNRAKKKDGLNFPFPQCSVLWGKNAFRIIHTVTNKQKIKYQKICQFMSLSFLEWEKKITESWVYKKGKVLLFS